MTSAQPRLSRIFLAAACAAAFTAAPAIAGPAYLKIGDIKGESTDSGHEEEIEVVGWHWGASGGGGVGAGKSILVNPGVVGAQAGVEYTWKVEESEKAAAAPGEAEITLRGSKIRENVAARPRVSDITLKRGTPPTATPTMALATPLPRGSVRVKTKMPWLACRVGDRYPQLQLARDGTTYTLSDVTVASCGKSAGDAADRPTEEVAFYYSKISW